MGKNGCGRMRTMKTDGRRAGRPVFIVGVGGGGRNRTGVHGFAGRCITTLPPRLVGRRPRAQSGYKLKGRALMLLSLEKSGAGNESRTRDLNLGKVALYQLSYSRERKSLIIQ